MLDVTRYETLGSRWDPTNSNFGEEKMDLNQIRSYLQNLELELSSVVGSLRSNALASEKVYSATWFCYQINYDDLHILD